MSAGDVKLMAVLGIYAGPVATIDLILMSFLVSGLWSLGLLVIRTPSFQWAVLGMKTRLNMKITIGDASASKELGIHSKRGAFPFGVATGIATLAMAVSAGISMSNR
jgi:Flp pilus assembly protein protease CpaA